MSKEEKFVELLTIAIDNGWKPNKPIFRYLVEYPQMYSFTIDTKTCEVLREFDDMTKRYSIGDIVSNWERGQISFVQALCNANSDIDNYAADNEMYNTYVDLHINIIRDWNTVETPKRLERLFEIFNHLF